LERNKDLFEQVSMTVDAYPGNAHHPFYPFGSMVININGCCVVHKDRGDLGGCIVLVLGPHQGGDLCLVEPKIVIQAKHGDVVSFNSSQISHFNQHYQGQRGSIVLHSEITAVKRQQDGNGWIGHPFVR
jgi:hypothetical protein